MQSTPSTVSNSNDFSPESIRPYAKAGPRKGNSSNRKRLTSSILTDTPVKLALMAAKEKKPLARKIFRACKKEAPIKSIKSKRPAAEKTRGKDNARS